AVAQVFDAQRGAGMDRDDEAEIVEVFDRIAVDGEDAVADLKAGNRRGALGDDFAEDRRRDRFFLSAHRDAGEENDGDEDVDRRTGEEDQEALPLRLREELAG